MGNSCLITRAIALTSPPSSPSNRQILRPKDSWKPPQAQVCKNEPPERSKKSSHICQSFSPASRTCMTVRVIHNLAPQQPKDYTYPMPRKALKKNKKTTPKFVTEAHLDKTLEIWGGQLATQINNVDQKLDQKIEDTKIELIDELKRHFDAAVEVIHHDYVGVSEAQFSALKDKDAQQDIEISKIKEKVGMLS